MLCRGWANHKRSTATAIMVGYEHISAVRRDSDLLDAMPRPTINGLAMAGIQRLFIMAMAIRRAALHISSVAMLIRRAALHISSVAMLIRRAALHISSVKMAYLQSIRRTSTCSKSNISQRRRNR